MKGRTYMGGLTCLGLLTYFYNKKQISKATANVLYKNIRENNEKYVVKHLLSLPNVLKIVEESNGTYALVVMLDEDPLSKKKDVQCKSIW